MQADTPKVGDKFWFQPYERRCYISPQVATITGVGRKWLTLDIGHGMRADKATLIVDGGNYSPPGRLWPSQADYEAESARKDALYGLRRYMESHASHALTLEQIKQANAIFGREEK